MENSRCVATNCDKSETCGHHKVKKFYDDALIEEGLKEDIILEDVIVDEDLSDICLPKYRLYDEYKEESYQYYLCKESYKNLFDFYDNKCDGIYCLYQKDYDNTIKYQSSCIECKLGEHITCTNPQHPTNKIIDEMMKCFWAEQKAFEEAGISEGTVTYICPICNNEAVANRYSYGGSIHGLGSGCKTCGTWHT
ncbi:hypothetical protein [Clostridium chromiireducens]|uniref:Uncharacterized protein n=1 Tax=Clostridium chromiireducens TaxID=225345 RepID=A0A1V4IUT9_9CLOT|nr:hypothetical protein [Clostridium chromiireducens]OPJ63663.1 hypothetical protein CLCHR_14780 [Clostridium chromiireducens]